MAYNYDKLYAQTPDALGPPTPALVDIFATHLPDQARILDLGCGQGRDALFLARQGHSVTGIDASPHGIRDLAKAAEEESLPIKGVVADITTYTPERPYDAILLDRTLHMLASAIASQTLARYLDHIVPGGWMIIADEPSNIPSFTAVLDAHHDTWTIRKPRPGLIIAQRTSG